MSRARQLRFVVAVLALPLAGCEGLERSGLSLEASFARASPPDASSMASTSLERGRSLLGAGNFGLAADAYKKAIETRPDDTQAWLGLAAAYDELRRFDLADRAYQQAMELGGPTIQLLNNRGFSYLLRGDYAAARRDLNAARAKDPSNARVRDNLTLIKAR